MSRKQIPKPLNYRKRLQRLLIPKTLCPHEITVVTHVHLCLFLFLSFFSSLTLFSHVSLFSCLSLSFHVSLFSCLSLFMSVSLSAQCTVCCVLLYMFASCKKLLSKDSCASLVPLGMKWACMCAEKRMCLVWCGVMCLCCVFVPVAM